LRQYNPTDIKCGELARSIDVEQRMKAEDRKAAVAAYKERRVVAGIYAVLCVPTGQRWIGRTPDLSTVQNRLWFTLRQGNNPHRTLQAAWNERGAESFALEEVERLDEETLAYVRDRILTDRLRYWCRKFDAEAI
jgi:hypothetical protein